jgi:hypothetical protein
MGTGADRVRTKLSIVGCRLSALVLLAPLVLGASLGAQDFSFAPTADIVIQRMLDAADVRNDDFVMSLGSGDGRGIIAAARRGAWSMGIESDESLVRLSQRNASAAAVYDQAQFVHGDIFAADISEATVLLLSLPASSLLQLRPRLLDMKPGSRIVSNTVGIDGWSPDYTQPVAACGVRCAVLLWIVPAKVAGTWQTPDGVLTLAQDFQLITGTLGTTPVAGKLAGDQITFKAGAREYTGKVVRDRIEGNGWMGSRQ